MRPSLLRRVVAVPLVALAALAAVAAPVAAADEPPGALTGAETAPPIGQAPGPSVPSGAPGDVVTLSGATTLSVAGRGWGHGIGMGQWGSLGYAVDHGWTYRQILDHFYGGTATTTTPDVTVTVRLEAFNDRHTPVYLESGAMTIRTLEGATIEQRGPAMRFRRIAPNTFSVEFASSCAGPWTRVDGEVKTSTIRVLPPAGADAPLAQTLAMCTGGTDLRYYRGEIRAVADPNGVQRTVNAVPLEQHQRGVVPRESPASWGNAAGGAGMNALRAQSVAARSYTLAESRYRYESGITSPEGDTLYARTCDTTSCHVYGGRAVRQGGTVSVLEHPNTDRAIVDTRGEIRVDSSGRPVYAMYSSSTGGHTAGGRFTPVVDDGDDVAGNPNHRWTTSIPVSTIESRYGKGTLQGIAVLSRNGLGDDGGRVTKVRLTFSGGTVELSGNEFRRFFGLKSDWFTPLGVPAGEGCPAAGLGGLDRLYSAYFLREPDLSGFAYWADRFRSGQSLVSISQAFTGSAEFTSTYGQLTNGDFVRLVYRNVMQREGDGAGVAYWTDILDRRVRGRGSVMALFSESAEYKVATGNCA